MRLARLKKAFNLFATESIIYQKANLTLSELNSISRVESYEEIPIGKCVVKSSKPAIQNQIDEIHYGLRLNVVFLTDAKFEVSFFDKVIWKGDEYRITDFKNLEQIPKLHRTVLEVEKA
jgi:hypothetical protein